MQKYTTNIIASGEYQKTISLAEEALNKDILQTATQTAIAKYKATAKCLVDFQSTPFNLSAAINQSAQTASKEYDKGLENLLYYVEHNKHLGFCSVCVAFFTYLLNLHLFCFCAIVLSIFFLCGFIYRNLILTQIGTEACIEFRETLKRKTVQVFLEQEQEFQEEIFKVIRRAGHVVNLSTPEETRKREVLLANYTTLLSALKSFQGVENK